MYKIFYEFEFYIEVGLKIVRIINYISRNDYLYYLCIKLWYRDINFISDLV